MFAATPASPLQAQSFLSFTMTLITSSPGKYGWATIAVLFNLIRLPLLTAYYIPRSTRPHPQWTIFQSVMNSAMNSFIYHFAVVQGVTQLDLQPGKLGDRFESVPKGPDAIFVGVAISDDAIVPTDTGAIWYPSRPKLTDPRNKPVILHFHPGGYVMSVYSCVLHCHSHEVPAPISSSGLITFATYRPHRRTFLTKAKDYTKEFH